MNINQKKKEKMSLSILVYYVYVVIYAGFWFITPYTGWSRWDGIHTLYTVTSVVSAVWIGYMMYRFLVAKDEQVNVLLVFSHLVLMQVLSPN